VSPNAEVHGFFASWWAESFFSRYDLFHLFAHNSLARYPALAQTEIAEDNNDSFKCTAIFAVGLWPPLPSRPIARRRTKPVPAPEVVKARSAAPEYDATGSEAATDNRTWVFRRVEHRSDYRSDGAVKIRRASETGSGRSSRRLPYVYVNPEAYHHSSRQAKFPDKTVLVMDVIQGRGQGTPKPRFGRTFFGSATASKLP